MATLIDIINILKKNLIIYKQINPLTINEQITLENTLTNIHYKRKFLEQVGLTHSELLKDVINPNDLNYVNSILRELDEIQKSKWLSIISTITDVYFRGSNTLYNVTTLNQIKWLKTFTIIPPIS